MIENGENNRFFSRDFIREMRTVSSTDARAVSLKKMMLLVVDRCARLERNFQQQIDELKGAKK